MKLQIKNQKSEEQELPVEIALEPGVGNVIDIMAYKGKDKALIGYIAADGFHISFWHSELSRLGFPIDEENKHLKIPNLHARC